MGNSRIANIKTFTMRYALTALLFITTATASQAQNLVVNPSFELTATNCSQFGGERFRQDLSANWDNANSNIPGDSCSSPDLFSACNIVFGSPAPTNMPNSALGYQYSRTGTRHAGIIVHEALDEYREYIQGRTITPLLAGQTYCVSMYVSLGNSVMYATNNIGIRFNNNAFYRDPCPGQNNSRINQTPQLNYNCSPITDTTNWVRLQWNYTAVGGEQFFIIGNFFNNANTTIVSNPGGTFINPYAYYFIDDVSIVPNSCCTADLTQPEPVCVTDPAFDLTAVAGNVVSCDGDATGTWSGPGITNSVNGTFSPASAGAGTHTVTFTMSCGYVGTTTVVVNPCATLSVCQETNGSLSVTGGTGPYTWQQQITTQDCSACQTIFPIPPCTFPPGCAVNVLAWSNFANGINVSAPSSYPIQVLDAAGGVQLIASAASLPACQACAMTAQVSAQQNVSCFGGSNGSATVSATGGTGITSYVWTPGNLSGATQSGLAAGAYTVTATSNGCEATTTVTISEPSSLPSASINEVVQPGCAQSNGSITVQATGGTPGYSYAWSPSGGNQATANGLAAGPYTVTVTDANGCTTTTSATLNSANAPTLNVTNTQNVSCFGGSNGSATVSASGGAPGYSYLWGNNQTGATATGLSEGESTVTVTDANGCSTTQTVVITEPTELTATATGGTTPCGQNNGSATVTPTGGTPNYTYAWSPSGGNQATASGLGGGIFTVTVTDANGCTTTATATITNTGGPTVQVTNTQNVSCAGGSNGSVTLSASGGGSPYTYTWTPGNQSGPTLSNAAAGTYSYSVTNTLGCVTTGEVTVTQPTALWPNAVASNVSCKGYEDGEISASPMGGTPPYSYNWSNGGTGPTITGIEAGPYTLTVTDANGCTRDTSFVIVFIINFSASITQSGNTLTANATGAVSYQWYLNNQPIAGATGPTYTYTQSGNYYVLATDANGCEAASNIVEATFIGVDETVFGEVAISVDPANGQIAISGTRPLSSVTRWQLQESTGRIVRQGWLINGQLRHTIEMDGLANGMYIVNLTADQGKLTRKVLWAR